MKEQKALVAERSRLVELLGVHFEKEEQLAPVAARILGTLMVTDQEGITFDQLVKELEASKSTVCTNLNILESGKMISYFTKTGDRKRYYTIVQNRLIKMIDKQIAKWKTERIIHEQLIQYKKAENIVREKANESFFDLSFHEDFLVFLKEATAAFQKFKEHLTKKA